MKFCKDCKWYVPVNTGAPGEFARCHSPKNVDKKHENKTCAVVGQKIPIKDITRFRWTHCISHRDEGWIGARIVNSCGKEGRWWEAK